MHLCFKTSVNFTYGIRIRMVNEVRADVRFQFLQSFPQDFFCYFNLNYNVFPDSLGA